MKKFLQILRGDLTCPTADLPNCLAQCQSADRAFCQAICRGAGFIMAGIVIALFALCTLGGPLGRALIGRL